MSCAFAPSPQSPSTIVNAIMAAQDGPPRGRPPVGYNWVDGEWVNAETGEPYSEARQHLQRLEKRSVYERRRYWDPNKGVRVRRLKRSAHASGKPLKIKPLQLKLHDLRLVSACVQIAGGSVARDVNLSSN